MISESTLELLKVMKLTAMANELQRNELVRLYQDKGITKVQPWDLKTGCLF